MQDETTTISDLKQKVKEFSEKRDWDQFHNAKELAIAISIEASELLEHFRWLSHKEVDEKLENAEKRKEIEHELADVFILTIRLAQKYNIDISKAWQEKMEKNEERYSVEKSKGTCKKYNEL